MKERIIWGILAAILLVIVLFSDSLFIKLAYFFITIIAISELVNLLLKEKNVKRFFLLIVLSFFVAACFYSIVLLRMQETTGHIIVWFAFLGAFSTDTFAYIFGMWVGQKRRHFIFPNISPKKTNEGVIGGIVGATIAFFLWGVIGNMIMIDFQFSIPLLTLLGFICSIIAQIGDLAASALKRKFGAKDFGSILPGHGGVLDRCDSLMLTAPFVLLFHALFPIIGIG